MTVDMWLALAILAIAILFFVTEWLRVDVVAIGVMVALMLTGLLSPSEAISGFSNPAVLTIASLFIIGGAVLQTGLAGAIGRRILKVAGSQPGRLTIVIMITVALLSGFMSDTGTVAVLLPAIVSLAMGANIATSKLLIPLSYGALLGGATTLIGTPPNIIVSDLLLEQGLHPFAFFDFTPIGLVLLATGVGYMLLVGRRILPDYQPKQDFQRVETPEELLDLYRLPDNLFRLRIRRGSELIEKTVAESNLRQIYGLTILGILRTIERHPVAQLGETRLVRQTAGLDSISPDPETVLKRDDVLIAQGTPNDVIHASAILKLGVQPVEQKDGASLISTEVGVAEVLLPPRSSLVGKTLVEIRFGTIYRLTVLGIQRPGVEGNLPLKETVLHFGDSLLVQGPWQNILALRKNRRDFVVMGQPEEMLGPPARGKAPIAMLVLVGMLIVMIMNLLPLVTASMLAALVMIITGCLTIDDAYEAVDWKSIVLVAGMLPMSIALEKVGLVNLVAEWLADTLGNLSPIAVLGGLFLLTSVFTQVLSNTTTAVLVAPIALVSAQKLGVQPQAFLMSVAIAASMAFASPVASPVNTLVMGAGHYRFSDYIKVGVPLILLLLVISMLLLPVLWPL